MEAPLGKQPTYPRQPAPTKTQMKVPHGEFYLRVIDENGTEICKTKVNGPAQLDVTIVTEGE